MKVDELRRGLDRAGRREIDVVEARAAVGAKSARRRRRNHQLVGVVTVVVIAAIAVPIAVLRGDPKGAVRVGPQPNETVGGWRQIRKTTAGFPAGSSFSTIASTDHSLLLGGALPGGRRAAIWYSDDAFTWKEADVPATRAGAVHAIAASGDTALAIGSDSLGLSPFVWRSQDGGRTWDTIANGVGTFGPQAQAMGRPFVDGMNAYGMWTAFGGASNGYGGVWTSTDGEQWQQTLDTKPGPPDTGVGSVKIVVDARDGHSLAYGGNVMWESDDASAWSEPVLAAVPEPYLLQTIAPGATIAFGDNKRKHGQPTPLMRRVADREQAWVVEPTFLEQFPDARVLNVSREGDLWVASGWSGARNHPDAWVSLDATSWQSLPAPSTARREAR